MVEQKNRRFVKDKMQCVDCKHGIEEKLVKRKLEFDGKKVWVWLMECENCGQIYTAEEETLRVFALLSKAKRGIFEKEESES